MNTQVRPLVRARLFVQGSLAFAWISADMKIDDWDCEPIRSTAEHASKAWNSSAFEACVKAFRRLQRKHVDLDIVVSLDGPPGVRSYRPPRTSVAGG